jgi:WD40 repeat protein
MSQPSFHHRGPVTAVARTPAGELVTAGYDGAVALHGCAGAQVLGTHAHLANAVAVTADGQAVLSASSDRTVGRWTLDGSCPPRFFDHHLDDVECVVEVAQGVAASGGRDNSIVVFDSARGTVHHRLEGHAAAVLSLAISGTTLLSTGDDGCVRSWDVRSGTADGIIARLPAESDSVAIDLARGLVAVGCDDGLVRVLDLRRPGRAVVGARHAGGVKAVVFDRTGLVASTGYDQRLRRTDPVTGFVIQTLRTPQGFWERTLTNLAGAGLAAGSFDGGVWLEGLGGFERLGPTPPGNPCINDVSATASGIVVACDDGILRSVNERGLVAATAPGLALLNAVTSHPVHGVWAGSHNQHVHVWHADRPVGHPDWSLRIGDGPVNAIRIRGDDAFVASYGGHVSVVDCRRRVLARSWRAHQLPVKVVELHPTRPILATAAADGGVALWDPATGALVRVLREDGAIANDLAFSPDGSQVAVVGRDFAITVFGVETGIQIDRFVMPPRSLKCVVYSDAEHVVVGDYWGMASVVSLDRRRDPFTVPIAENGVAALAKAHDGIWAGTFDGIVVRLGARGIERIADLNDLPTASPYGDNSHYPAEGAFPCPSSS